MLDLFREAPVARVLELREVCQLLLLADCPRFLREVTRLDTAYFNSERGSLSLSVADSLLSDRARVIGWI